MDFPKKSILKEVLDDFKTNSIMDQDLKVAVPKKGYSGFKTAKQIGQLIDKEIRKHQPSGAAKSALPTLSLIMQTQTIKKNQAEMMRVTQIDNQVDEDEVVEEENNNNNNNVNQARRSSLSPRPQDQQAKDVVKQLPTSSSPRQSQQPFQFKGSLSGSGKFKEPIRGKSSVLPPRVTDFTGRGSRLARNPSRLMSVASRRSKNFIKIQSNRGSKANLESISRVQSRVDLDYNNSGDYLGIRNGDLLQVNSAYQKNNRNVSLNYPSNYPQQYSQSRTVNTFRSSSLYQPIKQNINQLQKGSGIGGGKFMRGARKQSSMQTQNTSMNDYPSLTLHNTSMMDQIDGGGGGNNNLQQRIHRKILMGSIRASKQFVQDQLLDDNLVNQNTQVVNEIVSRKPSPFPGFYGDSASSSPRKKIANLSMYNEGESKKKIESYLARFKNILLRYKKKYIYSQNRSKKQNNRQKIVQKLYSNDFLTKIILDTEFKDILQELNLFTNMRGDNDLVKSVLQAVEERRLVIFEEQAQRIQDERKRLVQMSRTQKKEEIPQLSAAELESSRNQSPSPPPQSGVDKGEKEDMGGGDVNQTQNKSNQKLGSSCQSPGLVSYKQQNQLEIQPEEWKEIGKNKDLQVAMLNRIMKDCQYIESKPSRYQMEIKDSKWKCDLMIKDISWSIECLFDILSGNIQENTEKQKGKNEWQDWSNFLNQEMIQDLNNQKWEQTVYVNKLGKVGIWKSKSPLFSRKFERDNPTFAK